MEYISIVNWKKYQHYKDRRPTWIKLLIDIIDEFDADGLPKKFHPLPDSAKLTLVLLLCLRANYNKYIPYPNKKWLKDRLGLNQINLQPLIDAGFIVIGTEVVQGDTEVIRDRPKVLPPEKDKDKESESDILKTKEENLDFSSTIESYKNLFNETFKPDTQYEINTFNKLAKGCHEISKDCKNHYQYIINEIADMKEYCKTHNKNDTDLKKMFVKKINKELT